VYDCNAAANPALSTYERLWCRTESTRDATDDAQRSVALATLKLAKIALVDSAISRERRDTQAFAKSTTSNADAGFDKKCILRRLRLWISRPHAVLSSMVTKP
jgi:hypothetical protein